jgi:hypothetical protein
VTRLMSLSLAAASIPVTAIRRPVDVIDASKLLISDRVPFKVWLGNSRMLARMCSRSTVMFCTRCWMCSLCVCVCVCVCVCLCVCMCVCTKLRQAVH